MTRTRAARSEPRSPRRCRLAAGAVILALVSATSAACSGSGDGGSEPFKIAMITSGPLWSYVYLAQSKGYFDEEGVDVEFVENTGSNTPNYVVSGQADLAMTAVGQAMLVAQQGKDVSVVSTYASHLGGATLVGAPDITSFEQLEPPGTRIGTLGPGTASYGAVERYIDRFDLGAEHVPFTDVPSLNAALVSGSIQAASGSQSSLTPLVDQSQANMLIDVTQSDDVDRYIGEPYVGGVLFGIADNLDGKREQVVDFLAAMAKGKKYFDENTDQQIAEDLREFPSFQSTPVEILTKSVTQDRAIMFDDNSISEEAWTAALPEYEFWGLPTFDSSDEALSYENFVDMSYNDAAAEVSAK